MELDRNYPILVAVFFVCMVAFSGCRQGKNASVSETDVHGTWRVADFGPYRELSTSEITLQPSGSFTAKRLPVETKEDGGIPVIESLISGVWRLETESQADGRSYCFVYLTRDRGTSRLRVIKQSDLVLEYVLDPEKNGILFKKSQ